MPGLFAGTFAGRYICMNRVSLLIYLSGPLCSSLKSKRLHRSDPRDAWFVCLHPARTCFQRRQHPSSSVRGISPYYCKRMRCDSRARLLEPWTFSEVARQQLLRSRPDHCAGSTSGVYNKAGISPLRLSQRDDKKFGKKNSTML